MTGNLQFAYRWVAVVCVVVGCGKADTPKSTPPGEPTAEAIDQHNRGVGLMGRFEYAEAAKMFEKLAADYPNWHDVRVDWAIAVLNRQEEGDTARAVDLLGQVLKARPADLRALYCRGLLLLYEGKTDESRADFERVLAADPRDAYAAYFLGQLAFNQSRLDEAEKKFQQAADIDPYLRSAYYGLSQVLQRAGKPEEAKKQLATFERLADNPQSRLAELKYTRMGPKAEVVAYRPVADAPPTAADAKTAAFAPPVPLAIETAAGTNVTWDLSDVDGERPNMTACDIDSDGRLDLFLTRALRINQHRQNAVLLQIESKADAAPRFRLAAEHPLASITDVNAAVWGDYDNDGLTDVYLCRRGPNQLWRQTKKNEWTDVTATTRTDNGKHNTVAGRFVDADHDGDLDLLLANADGPSELLSNNRDSTFRSLAKEVGLADDARPAIGLLPADLDHDRDLDLIILRAQPPHTVLINDRLWKYGRAKEFAELEAAAISAAVAADANADGQVELYTASQTTIGRWEPDRDGMWTQRAAMASSPGHVGQVAIEDVDGELGLDLLVDQGGQLRIQACERARVAWEIGEVSTVWAPVVFDFARGPAIIDLPPSSPPRIWLQDARRGSFFTLTVTGKEEKAKAMRSNASGLGVRVAVRVGTQWTVRDTLPQFSGPGQSLQPLAIRLGQATQADFIQLYWPDGVFQSELALEAGKRHTIAETQRQLSSCPVVFVWNGSRYEFVTDVLGVGGIGFNVGRGEYPPPRPWENLLLPDGVAQPRDGRYQIKLSEPMEEVCYLDAARLVAYDIPPGWNMVIDERFAAGDPWPTGKPLFFRRELAPKRATNDRGANVTAAVARTDGVAAPPGNLHPRFIGRTAPHELTIEFAEPLDPGAPGSGNLVLVADGWIEYPYSQTMFAAWQAGATYDAPTLSARDSSGRWHVVCEKFGYPAGMPRIMALPISRDRLPRNATALKLSTNMEIYWDRVSVVPCVDCPQAKRHTLPLAVAQLAETGFARRTTLPQRRPHYDYARRAPTWDTLHPAGWYTAFGPVEELNRASDDGLAIFGPGEEIHLEFTSPSQPPDGWSRRLVLELDGWCKDRDLFTQNGETVEPLPRRNSTHRPKEADALMKKYNTRYRRGL